MNKLKNYCSQKQSPFTEEFTSYIMRSCKMNEQSKLTEQNLQNNLIPLEEQQNKQNTNSIFISKQAPEPFNPSHTNYIQVENKNHINNNNQAQRKHSKQFSNESTLKRFVWGSVLYFVIL